MHRRLPRSLRVGVALATASVTLAGCGFTGLYSAPLPGGASLGSNPYTVTAYFSDVLDLVPQSAVKVNDVAEGKVTSIDLTKCHDSRTNRSVWCAKVKFKINGGVTLPANVSAQVKQTSLLGEKYVSLQAPTGPPSAATLRQRPTIAYDDTGSANDVEQVLAALSLLLNNGGLEQIKTISTELNNALQGNEGQIRDLLGQLNTFVGTLNGQKSKILTALDQINTLAATLNKNKASIGRALDTFPKALQILSGQTGNITKLLNSLAHLGQVTTSVVNATATEIGGSAKTVQQALTDSLTNLDPTLKALNAAGGDLPKALKIALTFPFPLGTTRSLVRGDYANLALYLNLDLNDELCGLLGFPGVPGLQSLCTTNVLGGLSGSSKSVTGATKGGAAKGGAAKGGAAKGETAAPVSSVPPVKNPNTVTRQITAMIIGASSK